MIKVGQIYKEKTGYKWCNGLHGCAFDLCMFDIAPVDDWTKSLIKVGEK